VSNDGDRADRRCCRPSTMPSARAAIPEPAEFAAPGIERRTTARQDDLAIDERCTEVEEGSRFVDFIP